MHGSDTDLFSSTSVEEWWNPQGRFHTLHTINPVRLRYIEEHAALSGSKAIDIGCGGGLLAEAMARRGACVTGLEIARPALVAARKHALEQELPIEYVAATAEQYSLGHAHKFEIVCCMELLEHVCDPQALIQACALLAAPEAHLFFSTINRSTLSFLLTILGAEYLFGLLPMGTHDYQQFLRPSELSELISQSGLHIQDLCGLTYLPTLRRCFLNRRPRGNYLLCARQAPRA